MNASRGNQVLRLIDDAVFKLESESERLALLLAEARREKYWRLRNFKSEKDWIASVFPEKSLRVVRQLAKLGQLYENEPEIITEIGVAKADAIKSLPHRNRWVAKARKLSLLNLVEYIKYHTSRIKTPYQARRRIEVLEQKVERLLDQVKNTRAEIDALKTKWQNKSPEDCSHLVCDKTLNKWKDEGVYA
jgi:hypothetical protein